MTSLPLDPKKLLGFKLIPLASAESSGPIAIKLGIKGTIQLGVKAGGKTGTKNVGLPPRD